MRWGMHAGVASKVTIQKMRNMEGGNWKKTVIYAHVHACLCVHTCVVFASNPVFKIVQLCTCIKKVKVT